MALLAGLSLLEDVIGFNPISVITGGKEAGFGRAKPNTLPWFIDKLKGIDDNQAIDMAQTLVQMKTAGAGPTEIIRFLKSNSGEKVLGPEEFGPILSSLSRTIAEIEASGVNRPGTTRESFTSPARSRPVLADSSTVEPGAFDQIFQKFPWWIWVLGVGAVALIIWLFFQGKP